MLNLLYPVNMKKTDYTTFCLLCSKAFASARNLKRHTNYAHRLCEPPAYVCNFCHIGFARWDDYEKHHSERLMKTFARKTKKRKVKSVERLGEVAETATAEAVGSPSPEIDLIVNECLENLVVDNK